jgi:hypothetical protein
LIPRETIQQIKDAARIEEVVGEFVHLKRRGVNMIGLCPFHNEKTPSFTVSPAKGIFKCFGCGEAGSSIDFVMKHEHYTYPQALKFLAQKYGIEVEEEEQTPEQIKAENEREGLFAVTAFAAKHFVKNLHETDEGKAIGLTYFNERGMQEHIVQKFELGYSPDKWDDLLQAALDAVKAGPSEEQIAAAEAAVQQARAVRDARAVQLEKTVIKTPIDGVVTARYFSQGEVAGPGQRLVAISQPDQVTITIYAPASLIDSIQVDDIYALEVESAPGQQYQARVTGISDEPEFTMRQSQNVAERAAVVYAITLQIENPDDLLRPGLPADVLIPVEDMQP